MSGKLLSPRKTPRKTRSNASAPDSPPGSSKEKRIEQQLGPEWTKEEINIFFAAIKSSSSMRTDWERIASSLPGRTAEMVRGLYAMHKDYLALPEASPLALFTIVKTFYNNMHSFMPNDDTPGSSNQRGKGKAKPAPTPKSKDSKTPASKGSEKKSKTASTPSRAQPEEEAPRSRTRKQLFPDSQPSPRRGNVSASPYNPPKSATPSRKRKTKEDESPPTTPSRSSTNPPPTPDSQLPLKLRGKALKGKISPSKGALPHETLYSNLAEQPEDMPVAHATIHDRLLKFLVQANSSTANYADQPLSASGKWAAYEWFYADVDRPFFQQNEFQECLNSLDLDKVRKLSRLEWSHVRSIMGKPRRLSAAFLKQERIKLERTRSNVRAIRTGEAQHSEQLAHEVPPQLFSGSNVIAYVNNCIKRGVVQEVDDTGTRYHVLFDGCNYTVEVADTSIMAAEPEEIEAEVVKTPARTPSRHTTTPGTESASKRRKTATTSVRPHVSPRQFTTAELRNVAGLVYLVERKAALLDELTQMHNQAEIWYAKHQEYPGWFQQRYAVLIVRLEEVNQQLEPSLMRLHTARSSPAPVSYNGHGAVSPVKYSNNETEERPHTDWSLKSGADSRNQARSLIFEHQGSFNSSPPMREYAVNCMALLLQTLACAEHAQVQGTEASSDVAYSLDSALAGVQPKAEENMPIFTDIARSVGVLKEALTKEVVDV